MFARIAVFVAIAFGLTACGSLNVTSAFHVNPIAKPYLSEAPDTGYEYTLTRDPFDLDQDCLPGLGGKQNSAGKLVCSQSAVEAIVDLARITAPASNVQLAAYPPDTGKAVGGALADPAFQSRLGRNRLQDHLVAQSNEVCDIHKAAMFGKITSANIAFDLATIGLTTASALVTGGASTILSGAAAATAGGRGAINENLVQNLLVTAITESIDNTRANKLTAIRVRQSDNLDTYSIEAAVGDVLLYHEECSIYAGLETLRQQASEIKTSREEYLERAKQLIEFAGTFEGADAEETKEAVLKQAAQETAAALKSVDTNQ